MKHAIYIVLFFVFIGVISGAFNLLAALVTVLVSGFVLLFKWLEIDKASLLKPRHHRRR